MLEHTVFKGRSLLCPPFAWQHSKAMLFYFTQNSASEIQTQHWCIEAKSSASVSHTRVDGPGGLLTLGRGILALHPSEIQCLCLYSGSHVMAFTRVVKDEQQSPGEH